MSSRTRLRRVRLVLTVLFGITFTLAFGATLHAQVISDPRVAEFDPSLDHWAVLDDGQPAVLRYDLELYLVGSSTPFGTVNMGKPSPDPDGKIRYDFASQLAAWSLPGGTLEARVSAVGPEGAALSDPSNPFTFTAGSTCTVSLSATTASAPAAGGSYAVGVSTGTTCGWTATTTAPWMTLSIVAGSGSWTVPFAVQANASSSSRVGIITIGGQTLTVTQAGTALTCSYTISPKSISLPAPGGWASFIMTAGTGCSWTASTSQNWITIAAGSGSGGGTVSLNVAANPTTATRTGTVTVQGQTFTVTQAGAASPPCTPSTSIVLAQPSPQSLAAMWQSTGAGVTAGQAVTITAASAQTWVSGGQSYTAAGNPGDVTSGTNVPMPGAPRMALVGRIGAAGTPFLVGTSLQFTAQATGPLFLAPNDLWYMLWNNTGSLTVSVCVGSATCSVGATATVTTTATVGAPVPFAATGTPSGCGSATPTYSWNFGDGSPISSVQNPTHTYATAGTYTWTLTVGVATATTTRSGTIDVRVASACTPSTSIVLAQPSPQSLAAMWQSTGAGVTAGQAVTITAAGAQTWVSGGQSYTAAGNPGDVTSGTNVPMPGAPRMALVGRIGAAGTPFLVGTSLQFTAQATGPLFLAPNDLWYMLWNDAGSLTVTICR